jgi:hypothetical protein
MPDGAEAHPFNRYVPDLGERHCILMEGMTDVVRAAGAVGVPSLIVPCLDMAVFNQPMLRQYIQSAPPKTVTLEDQELPVRDPRLTTREWLKVFEARRVALIAAKTERARTAHRIGVAAGRLALTASGELLAWRIGAYPEDAATNVAIPNPEVLQAVTGEPGRPQSPLYKIRHEFRRRERHYRVQRTPEAKLRMRHVVLAGVAAYAARADR